MQTSIEHKRSKCKNSIFSVQSMKKWKLQEIKIQKSAAKSVLMSTHFVENVTDV